MAGENEKDKKKTPQRKKKNIFIFACRNKIWWRRWNFLVKKERIISSALISGHWFPLKFSLWEKGLLITYVITNHGLATAKEWRSSNLWEYGHMLWTPSILNYTCISEQSLRARKWNNSAAIRIRNDDWISLFISLFCSFF